MQRPDAMVDSPSTRATLLVRIRDPRDGQAWEQFRATYAPLLHGFGRRHGLQEADADDLTQDVLRRVAGAIKGLEYDPERGSFRGWLFTVARNELRKFLNAQRRLGGRTGAAVQQLLEDQPAPGEVETWDEEFHRRLFQCAADQVRGDFRAATWQAFWETAVEGKAAKEVAERLGLTVAAVYLAKGRVMARLKEQIRILQGE
jgi:RNA polymerase sigma factor (sigma-70 family)